MFAGVWVELAHYQKFWIVEFLMARRKELQGVCNDLLDSFVSRYNDLNGYWALGVFQSHLQTSGGGELCFGLTKGPTDLEKSPFLITSTYYRGALRRHLRIRNMPSSWVTDGKIRVRTTSPTEFSPTALACSIELATDLSRKFGACKAINVRPHNPLVEHCSSGKHGPKNQKGE